MLERRENPRTVRGAVTESRTHRATGSLAHEDHEVLLHETRVARRGNDFNIGEEAGVEEIPARQFDVGGPQHVARTRRHFTRHRGFVHALKPIDPQAHVARAGAGLDRPAQTDEAAGVVAGGQGTYARVE